MPRACDNGTFVVEADINRRQRGTDGHARRQRLGGGRPDALVEEVPLGDLVLRAVAQGVEDGAPALVADVIAAEAHLCTAHAAETSATSQSHTQR